MSRDTNNVVFMGRVVHTPEAKELPSGTLVCNLRLANNRDYKKQDGTEVKKACFMDVAVFDHSANFVRQYVEKGDKVEVEGSLEQREYEAKDGSKKSAYSINARELRLIAKPKDKQESVASEPVAKQEDEDDLPF